jgi:PAT family beta-lactamase induction signal transducer AmpG
MVVMGVLIFGIIIREREGEGRLPWSGGKAHPRNQAIQVEAWPPLLINSAKAMLLPLSIVALMIFFVRSMPGGVAEAYHPVLSTSIGGWSQTDYTNTISAAQFAVGVFALVFGGWSVAKIGAQRAALIACVCIAMFALGFGLARDHWGNAALLTAYFWQLEFLGIMATIAFIPIAMRLCDPSVAATQFTLYMAASNVGRPIGNATAATADSAGSPELMYFALAAVFFIIALILTLVRFPARAPEVEEAIQSAKPVEAEEPYPEID